MDYKMNLEFFDWLIWDKEVTKEEWIGASEEAKDVLFKEFRETRDKSMNDLKFIPIYKGEFNKITKQSPIKSFVKLLFNPTTRTLRFCRSNPR